MASFGMASLDQDGKTESEHDSQQSENRREVAGNRLHRIVGRRGEGQREDDPGDNADERTGESERSVAGSPAQPQLSRRPWVGILASGDSQVDLRTANSHIGSRPGDRPLPSTLLDAVEPTLVDRRSPRVVRHHVVPFLAHEVDGTDCAPAKPVRGRTADRSARCPLARTLPVATAASQLMRPSTSPSQVCASVSTTFGGVPRV